jgi:uncharacterized protein YcfL
MKKMTAILACGAVCMGVCLSACTHEQQGHSTHGREGGSIASKVEELGEMTYLKVTDMRAARRDNLLRIQFTVTNSSHRNEQLYYRFRWLDADGFTVWEEEPWKPELIYGKQNKVINIIAPTFKAVDFRLELQSPRNAASGGSSGAADRPYH